MSGSLRLFFAASVPGGDVPLDGAQKPQDWPTRFKVARNRTWPYVGDMRSTRVSIENFDSYDWFLLWDALNSGHVFVIVKKRAIRYWVAELPGIEPAGLDPRYGPNARLLRLDEIEGLTGSSSRMMIRWFAGVSLTEVAAHSLLTGLVLSALETAGRIGWGHEALLVANVPIVAWAAARWWTDRKR